MATDLNTMVKATGQQIVQSAGQIIAKDVQAVILGGEQFPSPESEVPSALGPVTPPLTFIRKLRKRQMGYSNPTLARFATGGLLGSIHSDFGELTATIDASSTAADVQQEGGGPWKDERGFDAPGTPARPFMGVSTRAYNSIEAMANAKLEKLKSDLESVELETVRLTV